MNRWAVKVGTCVLNVVHPCRLPSGKEISSLSDLKMRAEELRDDWIARNMFIDERVYVEYMEVE